MRSPGRLLAFVVTGALLALALGASPAFAKPCWKVLIDDWYDGKINNVYPVACYHAAIENAPEDVRTYSDLQSDIRRALAAARTFQHAGTTYVVPADASPPAEDPAPDAAKPKDMRVAAIRLGREDEPTPEAIGDVGRKQSGTVPLPLIAVGAIGVLLLASAATALVARRIKARRPDR